MSKAKIATNLLGKVATIKEDLIHCWPFAAMCWQSEARDEKGMVYEANHIGKWFKVPLDKTKAEIVAVFTEGGDVKVALVTETGDTAQAYLTHIAIDTTATGEED